MKHTVVRALLCLLILPASPAVSAEDDHPLLDLARERADVRAAREAETSVGYYETRLRRLEHEIGLARPPAGPDCARHMAAGKFGELHQELAQLHRSAGELEFAAASYRNALDCRPRSVALLASHADVAMARRDMAQARASIEEALSIDSRDIRLNRIAGQLDFLEERWADAAARFRYVASGAEIPEEAAAAQLMYWVAQRRAGVAKPSFAPRRPVDDWPRPVMLFLSGEYSEAELARVMKESIEPWENGVPDHRLTAALFYVGELHLARGETETARRYFAAVVTTRQTLLDEYSLAVVELAKLGAR